MIIVFISLKIDSPPYLTVKNIIHNAPSPAPPLFVMWAGLELRAICSHVITANFLICKEIAYAGC